MNQLANEPVVATQLISLFAGKMPNAVVQVLGLGKLGRIYAEAVSAKSDSPFLFRALDAIGARVDVADEDLEHIPRSGPTIIVANHPYGALDGLIAGALAMRRRADVRIIANEWLYKIPEMQSLVLSVDVFAQRVHGNASTLRAAIKHLNAGGLLIIFPAGVVSHWQPAARAVVDPPWNRLAATLARRTGAAVVPMHFAGGNSWLFQLAGMINANLRTALLPRELLQKKSSKVVVRIGRKVSRQTIESFPSDEALTGWLRLRTYDLESQGALQVTSPVHSSPLIDPIPVSDIVRELTALPKDSILVNQGPFKVYLVRSQAVPLTMREVGRLREVTFRQAGEGTGAALDLDRFDQQYLQIILFDESKRCVVGGYRVGCCDELLRASGRAGIYTHSLFRFHPSFIRELDGTLELGRSFVRPEYQRSPLALALLWRGIGEVLVRNPRYRQLMGPVSISANYAGASRRLMISFLENLSAQKQRRPLVSARKQPKERLGRNERAQLLQSGLSVRQLGRLVADVDANQRGVPVLLERYLELGGRVLALNVDPDFGHCVDALVVVDVPSAPESMLKRFLGAEGLSCYLRAHRGPQAAE